jgi:hypothetical protein
VRMTSVSVSGFPLEFTKLPLTAISCISAGIIAKANV